MPKNTHSISEVSLQVCEDVPEIMVYLIIVQKFKCNFMFSKFRYDVPSN